MIPQIGDSYYCTSRDISGQIRYNILMITIQEVHKYLQLTKVGMASPVKCPIDKYHPDMVSWLDEDEKVCFMCLACSAKVHPGDNLIKKIKLVNSTFTKSL